uniref:Uncharacterized protein n=1 Tax=Tanacetum cinerariifolium TaxID=118510 RepID=A0A6L2KU52_TANCI|nr:hypothetical protein [Tanacetum cinerariifolium]
MQICPQYVLNRSFYVFNIWEALRGNKRDVDSIWEETGQDCNITRSGFKDARRVPGDGVAIPSDAGRTYKRWCQDLCDDVRTWLDETLKKGSPFRPDSKTNEPSLRTYQLWKKTFYEETHKLNVMTELLKSHPKKTYKEDLESEIVMVKMPSYMSFLGCANAYDEPIDIRDDFDINTLTMKQYMALIQYYIRPGIVKPKIDGDVKFKINGNFMRELRRKLFKGLDIPTRIRFDSKGFIPLISPAQALKSIQVMADHSHNWSNEATTKESVNDSSDNVDIKKLKENIHAIQDLNSKETEFEIILNHNHMV